jgi:hypothetical protein
LDKNCASLIFINILINKISDSQQMSLDLLTESTATCITWDERFDNAFTILKRISDSVSIFLQGKLSFRIVNEDLSLAYGNGASREICHKIINELISDKSIRIDGYFGKFSNGTTISKLRELISWENLMQTLAAVIIGANTLGYILPFHFEPQLLFHSDDLTKSDCEFYCKIMFPETFESVSKLSRKELTESTAYDSIEDYYKDLVCRLRSDEQVEYGIFVETLNCGFNEKGLVLDKKLSGDYVFLLNNVIKMFYYNSDVDSVTNLVLEEYWTNFLKTLNEIELKQLLMAVGSTISLNAVYNVNCRDVPGVKISTCFGSISINPIFVEEKYDLKSYFLLSNDKIRDENYSEVAPLSTYAESGYIARRVVRILANGGFDDIARHYYSSRGINISTIETISEEVDFPPSANNISSNEMAFSMGPSYTLRTATVNNGIIYICEGMSALSYSGNRIIHVDTSNTMIGMLPIRGTAAGVNGIGVAHTSANLMYGYQSVFESHHRHAYMLHGAETTTAKCRKLRKPKREIVRTINIVSEPKISYNRSSLKIYNKNILSKRKNKGSRSHIFNRR